MKQILTIFSLILIPFFSFSQSFDCSNNITKVEVMSTSLNDSYGCNVSLDVKVYSSLETGQWSWNCGQSSGNVYIDAAGSSTGSIGYYESTGGNNCDNYVINCPIFSRNSVNCPINFAALPVDLIYFKAENINKGVYLSWKTGSELNNKGFSVERKTADNDWEEIQWIEGVGFSESENIYSFEDEIQEIAYYRLIQKDFDDTHKISPIVSFIPDDKPMDIKIRPTVTNNSITVQTNNPIEEFTIFNLKGEVLQSFQLIGENEFDLSNLPSGPYFVLITTIDGTHTGRVIKQ